MMPSEIIAWECGSCTFTNEGSEPGPCVMCRTKRPRRCAIVAGATAGDGVGNWTGLPLHRHLYSRQQLRVWPALLPVTVVAAARGLLSQGLLLHRRLCSRELFLYQHMWQRYLRSLQKLALLLPRAGG